jgi:hypothetical protein
MICNLPIIKEKSSFAIYTFTVSEKMSTQDTWFLWLISVILAHLRYVGGISLCRFNQKGRVISDPAQRNL